MNLCICCTLSKERSGREGEIYKKIDVHQNLNAWEKHVLKCKCIFDMHMERVYLAKGEVQTRFNLSEVKRSNALVPNLLTIYTCKTIK
jgi:hypothetical protein